MGGGLDRHEVKEWLVIQVVLLGKHTLDEVMEMLTKTSSYRVQDIMRHYGFGEYKPKNLRNGAMYRRATLEVIEEFFCSRADMPGRIEYLLSCDQRMAVPEMLNADGEYLEDDECARVTNLAKLINEQRFRSGKGDKSSTGEVNGAGQAMATPRVTKTKAKAEAKDKKAKGKGKSKKGKGKGKAKTKATPGGTNVPENLAHSQAVKAKSDRGAPSGLEASPAKRVKTSDDDDVIEVDIGSEFISLNELLIFTSAKTRSLFVRSLQSLQGAAALAHHAPPSSGELVGAVDAVN